MVNAVLFLAWQFRTAAQLGCTEDASRMKMTYSRLWHQSMQWWQVLSQWKVAVPQVPATTVPLFLFVRWKLSLWLQWIPSNAYMYGAHVYILQLYSTEKYQAKLSLRAKLTSVAIFQLHRKVSFSGGKNFWSSSTIIATMVYSRDCGSSCSY